MPGPDLAGALERPPMPADPPRSKGGGVRAPRAGRTRLTGDMPTEEWELLRDWGRESGTSLTAILVGLARVVPTFDDPGLRLAVETEANQYQRAARAR